MKNLILGIETSCDDTALGVVDSGGIVLSSVIASQIDIHSNFGGVVPELASRAHEAVIIEVLERVLKEAGLNAQSCGLDAIAVTKGPGLAGSLMVGVAVAKALSLGWRIPLIGVNHLEGHIFALSLEGRLMHFPMAVLVVSGGHTMIVRVNSLGSYEILGETLDDAAGEAFDKVARFMGLGFPGGPEIEKVATNGDPSAIRFPIAKVDRRFDFSFSGPKTAVVNYLRSNPGVSVEDVAASFQASIVETLVAKTMDAAISTNCVSIGLSGGVGANSLLRERLLAAGSVAGLEVVLPAKVNCTDNGAMIAQAGRFRLETFGADDYGLDVEASLRL
ncbi:MULTISPECIES: tRNA (adenosine(37)-N6)-threonylcarbamoyltransferase complex transferase subunit TsaD [Acidithrix]|uniref:tRNA N6-adenosine threonylcarbamoyltransferase n=1 Tax=Acidithrix ferrooxidans TaxID=1280514 RepID=A0A0D8HEM4_9ACTN|nr:MULTISPECIES: tRNA (adenosine(37)-N6)-threonylcarbamoyltransferase complex transferase subunit TsaD [Acidithrix]KJF16267.1 tRNA N6-adenosine threonylcarbamoyltransferase [Acidithrix ferrooxidans]